MKVLYVGDATVHSGFARCTHNVCDALHKSGHKVDVLGIHYHGDPHQYPYDIYPCASPHKGGRDSYGISRLPVLMQELSPDVIVLQNDPWNIPSYLEPLNKVSKSKIPPVVGFLAVDGKNQYGDLLNHSYRREIVGLSHVVCWTQFGVDELVSGGYEGPTSVVPLGVSSEFKPHPNKAACKKSILPESIDPNSFVVGYVGRNQPRKRLDLTIGYFAEWIKEYAVDDAVLYIHSAPTGEYGVDLIKLVTDYYEISGKVIIRVPGKAWGVSDDEMMRTYNAFDVFFTTTQGEGWGYPVLEAMACGVPCVVPDWSALGDWTTGAAVKIPCTSTAMTAPANHVTHTVGGIADRCMAVAALDRLYTDKKVCWAWRQRGLAKAAKFPEENTGTMFRDVLQSIVDRCKLKVA
jgi:D-inositol-3-phosphate glycosyltransferase